MAAKKAAKKAAAKKQQPEEFREQLGFASWAVWSGNEDHAKRLQAFMMTDTGQILLGVLNFENPGRLVPDTDPAPEASPYLLGKAHGFQHAVNTIYRLAAPPRPSVPRIAIRDQKQNPDIEPHGVKL